MAPNTCAGKTSHTQSADGPRHIAGSSATLSTPTVLLFLALATVFLFGGARGHFYQERTGHDHITADHMRVALNLSPEHGFLGFYRLTRDEDGELAYEAYNRFPVLGYALIKLAALPYADDLSAQLAAARTLMLAFFAGAATLAYLALCRLAGSRWTALAATLLAFSSYYALHYNDMVATEGVIDLFGMMLVLHGMAVFATAGRFGQLLAKTCAALLLGWHVYALLAPFVLLGLAGAFRQRDGQAVRRHLTLGAVALGVGALVLAANFTREYVALGGDVAPTQLPSVASMLYRTGLEGLLAEEGSAPTKGEGVGGHKTAWSRVAIRQLKRIAWSIPYAVGHFVGDGKPDSAQAEGDVVVALGFTLAGSLAVATFFLFFSPATRHRLPLAALALVGPCWAFGMRHQSHIPFEGMFNVGVPLAFFALALPHLERLLGRGRYAVLAGVVAVPTFALSSFLVARVTAPDAEQIEYERALVADVDAIRELAEGKTIAVSEAADACETAPSSPSQPAPGRHGKDWRVNWKYYFAGHVVVKFSNRRHADFVVSERIEGARSLTPGNQLAFLYERASYDAALGRYERHAKQGAPVLRSPDYDIHLVERSTGNDLLYVRDHCPDHQVNDQSHAQRILMGGGVHVFVHVWPFDLNDVPSDDRLLGHHLLDSERLLSGWRTDGKCYAVCRLPDYRIANVRAGSATSERRSHGFSHWTNYETTWEGHFSPPQRDYAAPVPKRSERL